MIVLLHHFYVSQIILGAVFIAAAWIFLRPKEPKSNFRVREADLRKGRPRSTASSPDTLAHARFNMPFQLPGIRIDGLPHEILGVSINAPEADVQKAYRELMKRYHPDVVGRPGTREWQEAQTICEAINRARNEMLAKVRRGKT